MIDFPGDLQGGITSDPEAFERVREQAALPSIIVPRDTPEKPFRTTVQGTQGHVVVHGNSVYVLEEPPGDYEIVYRVVGGVVSVEARMIDGGMGV